MKTAFIWIIVLVGWTVAPANADEPKSYDVSLSAGRVAGVEVTDGQYKLLVHRDEGKVQLRDLRSGDIFDLTGELEPSDSKYDRTEVHATTVGGVREVVEIRLGGTKYRIDFRART